MKLYEHTQIGYATLILLATGIALVTFWLVAEGFTWPGFVLLVVLDLCLIVFSTLTVEVRDGTLVLTFGPGIFRKQFSLSDVWDCSVSTHPWLYGWGIHRIRGGWLYNVSGTQAVVLTMRSGKQYRIGSDEPLKLLDAIRQALPVQTGGSDPSGGGERNIHETCHA